MFLDLSIFLFLFCFYFVFCRFFVCLGLFLFISLICFVLLVHRLDKCASGVVVVALTSVCAKKLSKNWSTDAKKIYLCISDNVPPKNAGIIDAPLGKATIRKDFQRVIVCKGIIIIFFVDNNSKKNNTKYKIQMDCLLVQNIVLKVIQQNIR
jgi:hypothetical protein